MLKLSPINAVEKFGVEEVEVWWGVLGQGGEVRDGASPVAIFRVAHHFLIAIGRGKKQSAQLNFKWHLVVFPNLTSHD